jgi:hypothetical protein
MIKTKEQFYTQSCLPSCLAMLCGVKMTKKQEGKILLKGLEKVNMTYAPGMLKAFVTIYKKKLNFFVENKYYAQNLKKFFSKNKYITLKNEKCDIEAIENKLIDGPIIAYVDAKFLEHDSYADHAPHFIVLEKIHNGKVTIIDPWNGKRKDIKIKSLTGAIRSLKTRFKYSPVIITF